jgi:hypothetical protein
MLKIAAAILFLSLFIPSKLCQADFQSEIVTLDPLVTIGYKDELYFTVILKTDFSTLGDEEIGFAKTEDLQLAPMQSWDDITPGLAVRVTYEEVRSSQRARESGVETQRAAVLERKAVKLVIGQKLKRKTLAS